MQITVKQPMIVHSDNQSAIQMIHNDAHHDRTKHIKIRLNFIRDEISKKSIQIQWIKSEQQIADIFTKTLPVLPFNTHRKQLVQWKDPNRKTTDQEIEQETPQRLKKRQTTD